MSFKVIAASSHLNLRPMLNETVKEMLRRMYSYHTVKTYYDTRIDVYNHADCEGDKMFLAYGGETYDWKCGQNVMPSATIVNGEHTVPQSLFKKQPPMVSDAHHLYAAPTKLNSDRSNYPFLEFSYDDCNDWCHGFTCSSTRPDDPDNYSCLSMKNKAWMPRVGDRGRIARAVFYFFTMYDGVDISAVGDLATFKKWNDLYPPTEREQTRNDSVNQTQGNRNPYVDDSSLVDKAF